MNIADLPRYMEADDFCAWCDHVFRLDDERVPYHHTRCGEMTICERCAEKFAESDREEAEILATYETVEARAA